MQSKLLFQPPAEIDCDALLAVVPEREPKLSGAVAAIDQATGGLLSEITGNGDFSGRLLETALLYRPSGLRARRLLLAGAGKKELGVLELRRLAAAAARQLKSKGVHRLAILLPEIGLSLEPAIAALTTGVDAANFEPDTYKKDRKPGQRIDELLLLLPSAAAPTHEAARRRAEALAAGHRFARGLANEPGNRLTPTLLAERAQAMAREAGLECELIDERKAEALKMGSFLSVGRGSAEPSVMIVLRYRGNPAPNAPQLALVGKGITFDTGGISIKPAAGMEWMKCDMSGGAAVLGAMQALAALKPKLNLIAVVAAAENMPGGKAQKPGDVQIAMNGKSIEVLNTDAEGRLVLADALCYARQLGATHLVDIATLTGACVVALGNVNSGVFANDQAFYDRFAAAAARAGEKFWRLPLDDEYFEQIKGSVGDILNTGGRNGGAVTAAMFLKEFVEETPWLHLDIAGTAYLESDKSWMPKGPAGVPVYTLVELAEAMAE